MTGIALDRWTSIDLQWWFALSISSLIVWLGLQRRGDRKLAAWCLMLTVVAAGAARHHWAWNSAAANDISCFAAESPRLVRIVARIGTVPQTIIPRADSWNGGPIGKPRSVCQVECLELFATENQVVPVKGTARLHAGGYLPEVEPGDEVEFTAQLFLPKGPQFDGDFDFATHLRNSGTRAILSCQAPAGIEIRQRAGNSLFLFQQRLRAHCETVVRESLSPDTAPLGIAILLGTRTELSDELRRDFAESGTTHILAISGVNVGILATLLWWIFRFLFRTNHATTIWLVLAGVGLYAFVADNNPPVFRAVVMSVVFLIGMFQFRTASPLNSLSAAACIVLLFNPTHLFDVGAQLSFLAVLGLVTSHLWMQSRESDVPDPEAALNELSRTWWERLYFWSAKNLGEVLIATAAVWLFTLPLMLALFQILSPVGFVVNVVLSPLSVGMLWMGYLSMIFGSIWQPLGAPFAFFFDGALWGLMKIVSLSARSSWGHLYVPGPPEWWLAGFYFLLTAGVTLFAFGPSRWRNWGWRTLAVWSLIGLALPLVSRREPGLTCRFLPVGHGVAVLLELPNGRNVLYDAGQMQNAVRAQRAVQQTVWRGTRPRIDALILSHADADHYNAVPGLLRSVPIDQILMHRTFLDSDQPLVKRFGDELETKSVPVRLVEEGDRLKLDSQVELIIRQPPWNGFRGSDNANSLVLEVLYAGRRILLTGDLEGVGLQSLLKAPPPQGGVDILLSPHHGSRAANSPALAKWAQPRYLIVSGGPRDGGDRLREVFGRETQVLSTHTCGTVTCRIDADGNPQITTFCSTTDHKKNQD